jgi:hypothetical protein
MYISIPKELITYFASAFAGVDWPLSAPPATIQKINFQLTAPFVPYNILTLAHRSSQAKLPFAWLLFHNQALSAPLIGKQSLVAFTYCLSLHLTTLIQSAFDNKDEFLGPDPSFLQHWWDCCMNGELGEMLLSHPHNANHVDIFLSQDCLWWDNRYTSN